MKIPLKSSEIRRNSRNKPIHPGILGGTIQPCFCTGSCTGKEYSGGTGQYSTKSSSLVFRLETKQPFEPCESVTVQRTGRSDRGPYGSMFFSYGTVLHLKWIVEMANSRFSRLDRTVQSRFKNHDLR